MHLLFVDESGVLKPPEKCSKGDWFVLGGIVIPEDTWFKVDGDLKAVKRNYQITGEIKWRYFFTASGKDTPLSHLDTEAKERLRTQVYQIVGKYRGIKIITVVAHVPSCYAKRRIQHEDDLYWFSYKPLIERFQYCLQDLSRETGSKMNGIVICDHRERRQDRRLQNLHFRMLYGHRGPERHVSDFRNILEGLFIVPSHLSTGIQLADMVAGAVYRRYVKNDARYYQLIAERIRTGPGGQTKGYGIVQLP